jgi:hypothetical protein
MRIVTDITHRRPNLTGFRLPLTPRRHGIVYLRSHFWGALASQRLQAGRAR